MQSVERKRILVVFGTRPEAIKMAPVVFALSSVPELEVAVCVTAQHRDMLDQVLDVFAIRPRYDLNVMRPSQNLTDLTSLQLAFLRPVMEEFRPDYVLVQGDTVTTFAASLASFLQKIPIAHIEAGLRTNDRYSPFPEEINRRLVTTLSVLHFPPTEGARRNLLREGVSPKAMETTGNTVVDALHLCLERMKSHATYDRLLERYGRFGSERRMVLVTLHRRENLGEKLASICRAISQLAGREDVEFVFPVHLNPVVRSTVFQLLSNLPRVHLLDPLDYLAFIFLLQRCTFVISDSGGIQEEAPALKKPILITRDSTERPEVVEVGAGILVGQDTETIVRAATRWLDDPKAYGRASRGANPFGDGTASLRIRDRLLVELGIGGRAVSLEERRRRKVAVRPRGKRRAG